MKIGIVGLGLMGGSMSIALKRMYTEVNIIGLDHNKSHCKEALELKIVDSIANNTAELLDADIIFLAVPVDGIIATMPSFEGISPNTTIIDLGSTKAKIVNAIPPKIRKNFVAAHPMTGTEKSGPYAAIDNLYSGKVVVLCDIEQSGKLQQELAKDIFEKIGMKIFYMDAHKHDRHAAYISHMPHALSYALANSVMSQEDPKAIVALAGGGFRDMSRIAKSSPAMWRDIFQQNSTHLLDAIECFSDELSKCKMLIKQERWDELYAWMEEANKLHKIV